jgi:diguanylate cyclase (GGDEF)-like protein
MKTGAVLFILLAILTVCLSGWIIYPTPVVIDGKADINGWDLNRRGTVSLEGEWNFYWNVDTPKKRHGLKPAKLEIPATWDEEGSFPSTGYGLYHMQLTGLEMGKSYSIKIPIVSNAYHFWIDDRLMVTNGDPGQSKETTTPFYKPREVIFDAKRDTVDLFFSVSNFHYRSGGIWISPEFGTAEQIAALSKKRISLEALITGSLLLSGLYHVVLYIYRKKEKLLLLFGLTCLVIFVRTLVIGEHLITILFPNFPWALSVRLEFLSFYTVVPLFTWFLHKLYYQEISKTFCYIISLISGAFGLLVLFTTAIVFTESIFYYQTLTIITIIYVIGALLYAASRGREGAKVVLVCATFYALTVINDILYINGKIDSTNLSSLGLFVFIFSQSYIIAKSSSHAFQQVETYSKQLTELNQNLEVKIYERTASLEKSRQELQRVNEVLKELSYHDPLTGLPNRRYFDDRYEQEWERAIEAQSWLSLLYLDIDYFKRYNDAYGHQQGDITLQEVAACLQRTLLPYEGIVARIGGEEFIALVMNQSESQMNQIAEECRNAVKGLEIPHRDSSISPFVTISIGVATMVPNHTASKRKLIRMADEALYFAKEEGRNLVIQSSYG